MVQAPFLPKSGGIIIIIRFAATPETSVVHRVEGDPTPYRTLDKAVAHEGQMRSLQSCVHNDLYHPGV